MRMDELKRGFWGYKKDSVYHYIVLLEEKASKQAAEKDARMVKLEAESQRLIAKLESEHKNQVAELEALLAALREENLALRDNQELVFSTMLEAQKYADQLKTDSSRQAKQAQERLSSAIQRENQHLGEYVKRIQQLRALIRDLLEEFDGRAEEAEKTLERLPAQAPSADLDRKVPEVKVRFGDAPAAGGEAAIPDRGKGEEWNRLSFM